MKKCFTVDLSSVAGTSVEVGHQGQTHGLTLRTENGTWTATPNAHEARLHALALLECSYH